MVKKVRNRKTGQHYAAKYIRKRKIKTSRKGIPQEEIEREIELLQDLGNGLKLLYLDESLTDTSENVQKWTRVFSTRR